ncbi:MAG: hypothetical protein ACRDIB_16355 [Ardenticatenaceae bacterium]
MNEQFSLSNNGEWDQSALFWDAPYLQQARIGLDGELYAKYSIIDNLRLIVGLYDSASGVRLTTGTGADAIFFQKERRWPAVSSAGASWW